MKRIAVWFIGTLGILIMLFDYRTSLSGATATPDSSPTALAPITASPSGSPDPTASPSGTPDPTASPSGTASATGKTVTGSVAQTRWGPVQVQLTIASGKITAVQVLQYPSGNDRDVEINNYAVPTLINETISAQSAGIDMVSGATVTSDGYLQSLQSALDQAGL
jgi:uncharacterized protein with FMN-binding domain